MRRCDWGLTGYADQHTEAVQIQSPLRLSTALCQGTLAWLLLLQMCQGVLASTRTTASLSC